MDDKQIIDLYWRRSETAISETALKYGNYCYSIAYNVLTNAEDAEESVSDTYLAAWNRLPPHRRQCCRYFWERSPATYPSAAGEAAAPISGAGERCLWPWKS